MAITITVQDFVRDTNLGPRDRPNMRFNDVVVSLRRHQEQRTKANIDQLKMAMDRWSMHDMKEITKRNQKNNVISKLATQVTREVLFFRQYDIARQVITPVLTARTPHVVNDADTSYANRGALMASKLDQLKMTLSAGNSPAAIKANLGTRNIQHWLHKGQTVAANPTMSIRCAESASLVVHLLRQQANFTLPLNIIEQGIGAKDGHFWVIAGEITNPSGTPDFGPDTFYIDLWGRATNHVNQVMGVPPGKRPFNMRNNSIKVLVTWPGFF